MAKTPAADLVVETINLHSRIQSRIGSALSAHGIGLSEYLVLLQLSRTADQKLRRKDLAELVGLTPSGVTRLLNPMEKSGLVDKEDNPRDARVSLVTLSAAGRRVIEEARVSFGHAADSLLAPLGKKQSNQFAELLSILNR